MKRNFKKIFILLVLVIASIISTTLVSAEAILDSFKATSKTIETPIDFITDFHVIKTTDGKHVYCLEYRKKTPDESIIYTKDSLITDNGMNYLLKEGSKAKNDMDHFIYKSALWIYMVENGLMEGTNRNIKEYYEEVKQSKTTEAKKILELIENAKKVGVNDTKAPTIKVDTGAKTFKLDNGYYVSNSITVTSSTGSYEVKLTSAPANSKVEKDGNAFVIKVPASSVSTLNTEVSFEVSNSKDIYVSYRYNPSDSKYQPLAATYKETKTASAKGSLSINNTVSVPFLKIDAETGEAISGAKLELTDSTGKVIMAWTSTKEAVVVTGLKEGKYTLTEKEAPAGYKIINATVKFSIDKNGKILDNNGKEVTVIKITNERKTGGVEISKQDITNKEELPGATLVIKDSNNKVVAEWESTDKPHYIEKLNPGTYTLTETIAPVGYVLSTETITFEVKDDGTITKVVMYNTPKTGGVQISKQDITNKKELPGATLVIKDVNGNIIDEWVSTDKPHYIEKLTPGMYTLTETIAPDGYVLSDETITFTVEDDGTITKVVMYNAPSSKDIPVEPTSSFKSMASTLIGTLIIGLGSFIIFKNYKKKENA